MDAALTRMIEELAEFGVPPEYIRDLYNATETALDSEYSQGFCDAEHECESDPAMRDD